MRFAALIFAAFVLVGCGQSNPPAPAALEDSWAAAVAPSEAGPRLTIDGYGDMHIGMTLADARRVSGQPMSEEALDADEPGACVEQPYRIAGGDQLWLMFEGDKLARITASENGTHVRTAQNVGVGSTDTQVRAAYQNLVEQGAHYVPLPAHNLIAWAVPQQSGILFEVNERGFVTAVHAGGPSILYMEGCA